MWDNGHVKYYLNGNLGDDQLDSGETAAVNTQPLLIGLHTDGLGFHGSIDEVRISKFGMKAAGIAASYLIQTTCPAANPNDSVADDAALQACLDLGGEIRLVRGSPGYTIASGLVIRTDHAVITSTSPAAKALFVAAAGLNAPMFNGAKRDHLSLSYLEINGNRPARNKTICNTPPHLGGFNFILGNTPGPDGGTSTNFIINDSRSTKALCGSSMWVHGSNFEIANNLLDDNGHGWEAPDAGEPWSDGLSLGQCVSGNIHNNTIINATDIALVDGGGVGCQIVNNTIENISYNGVTRHAFAGIALHEFCYTTTCGDHTGSTVSGNTITASPGMESFGIICGHHPWSSAVSGTKGATIGSNIVSGAIVNLAVDGVTGFTINANTLSSPGGTPKPCSGLPPTNYTVNSAHTWSSTLNMTGWIERAYDNCIP